MVNLWERDIYFEPGLGLREVVLQDDELFVGVIIWDICGWEGGVHLKSETMVYSKMLVLTVRLGSKEQ